MKIVFASSDEISIPVFRFLVSKGLVDMLITSPDAPKKRSGKLIPPQIKLEALSLGVKVYQPVRLGKDAREYIRANTDADTLISFSYGKIFGPKFLSLFQYKFNIHPSLLPKYRGPSPLYQMLINADREGGISIQDISLGVDEGDVFFRSTFMLDGTEDMEVLRKKVSLEAEKLVEESFAELWTKKGEAQHGDATYSSFIRKEDGKLDFKESAKKLHSLIRASYPWPKCYTSVSGEVLYILGVHGSVFSPFEETNGEEPGTVVSFEKGKGLKVATGDGYIYITRVQPPCKKEMDAGSYINGNSSVIGKILGV